MTDRLEKNATLYVSLAIAMLTIWTFAQRFLMDDAFISFRYAQHLANGLGIVWNPGERIEGYSNFLWVVLCAFGVKIGIVPERFSVLMNVPLFILTLYLTFCIARREFSERYQAFVALVLTGVTRSIYGFATSGLETTLQGVEFLALTLLLLESSSNRSRAWSLKVSGLLALMFLTRPDAAIPATVALYFIWRDRRDSPAHTIYAIMIPLVIVGIAYASWKLSYFGSLLPNSYHAKVRDLSGIGFGLFYVHQFLLSHLLYPFAILIAWNHDKTKESHAFKIIGTMVGAWVVYVILAGGDFMEFRFLVPVIPLFYILSLKVIELIEQKSIKGALYAALAVGVIHGNFAMEKLVFGYGIESMKHLKGHLIEPRENWNEIGRKLGEYFRGSDVLIAAGAAGAIPYYSGLNTVDFMGLSDKTIPTTGVPFSRVPGHRIISTLDYLVQRKVNLVIEPINHMMSRQEFAAWAMRASWGDMPRFFIDPNGMVNGKQINQATLIGVPINEEYVLVAWYLTYNQTVEKAIEANRWERVEVTRW